MTPIGTPPAPPASASRAPQGDSAKSDDRAKLKEAAKQFEAIFVRQMLAAARKTSFDDGLFDGQGMDTFRQMQDERFADIASQTGALGLASMIEAQLVRHLPREQQ